MNVALWVVQGLVAIAFVLAGVMKVSQPIDSLAKSMNWVGDVSPAMVRFIGATELLGALGLILPEMTGILPWLSLAAAAGLAIVMVIAAIVHLSRGEGARMPINLVFLVLIGIILYGRIALIPA